MSPDPQADTTGSDVTGSDATGSDATGSESTVAAEPDAAPVAEIGRDADETGLDLARSVASRIAATGRGTRRRRRSSLGPEGGWRDTALPGVGPRGVSAPGRVGGLASREPFTGPGPDEHDPTAVGSALHDLVSARGWAARADASAVLARWSELVGDQTAAHCQPVGLDDGTLRVRADSSAWATQLRLLAPRLVAAVNDRVGSTVVTELVVDGPVAPSWRHGRLGVQGGRGPRDTYG